MNREKDVFDDIEGIILADARKVYSDTVIDHFLRPRNFGKLDAPDCSTYMSGICGDTIGMHLRVREGRIERAGFETDGCGPTIACGSALTCMIEGLTVQDARRLTGPQLAEYLGGLPVENTHCADLAVNTLKGALEKLGNNGDS
jgi:nitrogen fixation protein NifU and related proteins